MAVSEVDRKWIICPHRWVEITYAGCGYAKLSLCTLCGLKSGHNPEGQGFLKITFFLDDDAGADTPAIVPGRN